MLGESVYRLAGHSSRFFMDTPLFISEADKQRIIHIRELLKKNAPAIYKLYAAKKIYGQRNKDNSK